MRYSPRVRAAWSLLACALCACSFRVHGAAGDGGVGDEPDLAGALDGSADDMPTFLGADLAPHPFLSVTPYQAPPTVDLTAEGTLDWAHWGWLPAGSYDHKATGNGLISDFTSVGVNAPTQYSDNVIAYTWTDGLAGGGRHDKTMAGGTTTGLYVLTGGFKITVPAGAAAKRLRFYGGALDAQGVLDVSLSDNSAPAAHDVSIVSTGGTPSNGEYMIDYAAGSDGQTLTLTWQIMNAQAGGTVTLQSATLQPIP